MTTQSTTSPAPFSTDELLRLADAELSTRARIGHVALLLMSLLLTTGVVSLWLTEPALPLRAHVAFAMLSVIGLSWAAFAGHALTQRRVLYARHRVIAGRMAVTFTATYFVAALAIAWTLDVAAGYVAAGIGGLLLGIAVLLLRRSQRALSRLLERRRELEHATTSPM